MNHVKKWLNLRTVGPNWLEYAVFAGVALIYMLTYKYWDFKSLTVWSTSILDCLVDGNLNEYYRVVHTNVYGAPHPYLGYNYLVLIPWAIWNIPVWIVQRLSGIHIVDHTWMMVWSQLFLVFALIITAYYAQKIIRLFIDDDYTRRWSVYLIVCCPLAFLGGVCGGTVRCDRDRRGSHCVLLSSPG